MPTSTANQPRRAVVSGRVGDSLGALRPLAFGIALSILVVAAMTFAAALDILDLDSAAVLAACTLPVLCSLPIAWGRNTVLEITPQGILWRRLLAPTRVYPPSAVMLWGFGSAPGTFDTLPTSDTGSGRKRFVLETTDGQRFEAMLTLDDAERAASLLLQHQIPSRPLRDRRKDL